MKLIREGQESKILDFINERNAGDKIIWLSAEYIADELGEDRLVVDCILANSILAKTLAFEDDKGAAVLDACYFTCDYEEFKAHTTYYTKRRG